MKKALVLGAGGFIGGHLVRFLKKRNYWVAGVDIKSHEHMNVSDIADRFYLGDLRDSNLINSIVQENEYDEVYQLAADMGGAAYIFTGAHDADIMHNSALINLNVLNSLVHFSTKKPKVFYSSSACIYPAYNQEDPENPKCSEMDAYPAAPDSEYGWEKLFSERLYMSYYRNFGLEVRIARFHNVFGPCGAWNNGKEKAPAALCRKISSVQDGEEIEIWGDGKQTRSFLYIDECLEGISRLMESDFREPMNIGSEEMISLNDFAYLIAEISGKKINIRHIEGPTGVRGRTSDNRQIEKILGWKPTRPLKDGISITYSWIDGQNK